MLRRLRPELFVGGFDALVLLLLVNLAVWAALDTLHAQPGAHLMLDGLYVWSFYLLLGLAACALVGRAYCRQAETRTLLIPTLSVSPYVLCVFWALDDLAPVNTRPAAATIAAVAYLIVLSVRILQAAFGSARLKAVVVAAGLVIAAPAVMQRLDLDTRLWLTEDTDQDGADDDDSAEALLYDQPARIVSAVDHMAAREPGRANVFYLGFAGDGEQTIFKREALFGQQAFDEHFGSGDRSMELINDNDDRDSFPIASLSALEQSLKLVAARMSTDEDVLVLLLTSHGSADGLAVVNGNLPLLQIAPEALAHALDESGIRWRIVIVSACYAGVFLDPLRNDHTMVITAADATHSSFGCDDDRDLTDFGEAFLHDALPQSKSLQEAFGKAAALIRQREAAQHEVPSNPQMVLGAAMRAKLAQLESAGPEREQSTIVRNQ